MSDFLRLAVAFFATVNPFAVARWFEANPAGPAQPRLRILAVAVPLAAALASAAALSAESSLDALDVAPETFRIAAGIVMLTTGVFVLWRGELTSEEGGPGWQAGLFPIGIPLLAGPASLVAALSYGADRGAGETVAAAVIAVVLAAVLAVVRAGRWRAAADALARLTAALLVVVAAGLIVTGVRDI